MTLNNGYLTIDKVSGIYLVNWINLSFYTALSVNEEWWMVKAIALIEGRIYERFISIRS